MQLGSYFFTFRDPFGVLWSLFLCIVLPRLLFCTANTGSKFSWNDGDSVFGCMVSHHRRVQLERTVVIAICFQCKVIVVFGEQPSGNGTASCMSLF